MFICEDREPGLFKIIFSFKPSISNEKMKNKYPKYSGHL